MKALTIELIHPPHPQAIEDRLDVPLGLLYIASMLEKHGHRVRVNDLSGVPEVKWQVGKADICGITVYAPTVQIGSKLIELCKKQNPKCKVAIGGTHPTAVLSTLAFETDAVILGEGELALLEMVEDYPNTKRLYRKPLAKNLDLYPNAAYHLIDPFSYKRTINGKRSISMLTSRGCSFKCTFCMRGGNHQVVKTRSPEVVAREIEFLKGKYGIEKFNFQDDTFTINRNRLHCLLDLLKPLKIGFRCHGRAGLDTKEDYVKLKEAGCDLIAWGIESGSQEILNRMNKQVEVSDNEDVIRWARETGITSRAFFIFGFPGENRKTIEETKAFIERTDPDQYFVSNFVPYPKTEVANNPKKYGITWINENYDDFYQVDRTGYGGVNIETEGLSREEFKSLEMEFREWIYKRERRGSLLEYEEELESKKREVNNGA